MLPNSSLKLTWRAGAVGNGRGTGGGACRRAGIDGATAVRGMRALSQAGGAISVALRHWNCARVAKWGLWRAIPQSASLGQVVRIPYDVPMERQSRNPYNQ